MNEIQGQRILDKLGEIEKLVRKADARVAWLEELALAWGEDEADRRRKARILCAVFDAKHPLMKNPTDKRIMAFPLGSSRRALR